MENTHLCGLNNCYRTRAIIIHGLYIFYPILEDQKRFLGAFFVKFCPYVWLVFKSGLWSRAGYDGACTVYYFFPRTQNSTKYDGLWTDYPFMIIKNGDHGFLYPSPRQCSGHMRRALDSKYWITFLCTEVSNQKDGYLTGLHTLIVIFYFTLLSMGYI